MLGLPPVTSVGVDKFPEVGTVIMVLEVSQFMDQHIVDASSGGFDKVWVQDDLTCW